MKYTQWSWRSLEKHLKQKLSQLIIFPEVLHHKEYWISPGGNTQQSTNYTATCLLSRKLSKLDEPDMQDTAGEAGTSS